MTDAGPEAFMRAVIAAPDDDLPRLVYADWLDERGDPLGEFIRVQVELAKLVRIGVSHCTALVADAARDPAEPDGYEAERIALRRRERELYAPNWGAWADGLPEELVTKQCPTCAEQSADWETNVVECRQCDSTGVVVDDDRIEFARGFVNGVTCTWDEWRNHAAAILASCPIRNARDGLITLTSWPEGVFRVSRLAGEAREHLRIGAYALDGNDCDGRILQNWSVTGLRAYTAVRGVLAYSAEFRGVRFKLPETEPPETLGRRASAVVLDVPPTG